MWKYIRAGLLIGLGAGYVFDGIVQFIQALHIDAEIEELTGAGKTDVGGE